MNGLIGLDWMVGFFASLLVAGAAYVKRSLSASGAAAAVIIGTIMYALGTLLWFGLLLAFFLSSTFWSRWKRRRKQEIEDIYEKSGKRDAGQVMANGGIGVLVCILNAFWPQPLWIFAFVGVMATVNADTWATEIGGLSKGQPYSIVTGKRVPKGTSGGVSALGLWASAVGALFIGLIGSILLVLGSNDNFGASGLMLIAVATCSGFIGALADSLIGAKWQLMYRCPACGKELEKSRHCGVKTQAVRGLAWMNNDAVNFISSVIGGIVAVLVYLLI